MERMRVGLFGNVAYNGCGAIAVYNVMTAYAYTGSFSDVLQDMNRAGLFNLMDSAHGGLVEQVINVIKSAWDVVGILGFEPKALRRYLKNRFKSVRQRYVGGWQSAANRSGAVITLFKWDSWSAHYVAGIRRRNGRKYKFCNHKLKYYDGDYITISQYMRCLKKNKCTRLAIVGVKNPRLWW